MYFGDMAADGAKSLGFDSESEARGEPHGAHHAELIFLETAIGFADGANDLRVEVSLSADEVEHFAAVVAHQQTVDGEVAALHILLRHFRINHAVRVPAVAVAHVRTERGNLDFQPIPWNQNHAELLTYCDTFRKQCRALARRGIRRPY